MHSELLFLLYLFGRTIRKHANKPDGAHILEAALLWLCARGIRNAKDLANSLGVSSSTISEQINETVKRGYLSVQPSKNDKRSMLLTVSDEGKKHLDNITEKMDEVCVPVLEPLTQEEKLILTTLLKKLLVH